MSIRGHVLVVDNDAGNLNALQPLISTWGYRVFTASSSDAALTVLSEQHIDLVIIDVRLKDENDPTDRSGIALAEEIDDAIAKILFSAGDQFDLRGKWLRQTDIHLKKQPISELKAKIERQFRQYVRYNHDLKINWSTLLSPEGLLVPLLKDGASEINRDSKTFKMTFESMLRRLFFQETRIDLRPLDAGRSGAGVVLVKPFYERAQGAPVVVKYGRKTDILNEHDIYQQFVEPFLVMHTTHMIGTPEISQDIAGMKLMFVGAQIKRNLDVYDFAHAFQSVRSFDDDSLEGCIRHLFRDTCNLWYGGKHKWKRRTFNGIAHEDLPTSYESQLRLQDDEKQARIQQTISNFDGVCVQNVSLKVDDKDIVFRFEDDSAETLPNPYYFWQHQRDCIPEKPQYVCITHGDLQARNLLVDRNEHTWLIDFQRSGWGSGLRDAAELESSIKFDLLDSVDLKWLIEFERNALCCNDLNQRIAMPLLTRKTTREYRLFERARITIDAIRHEATRALNYPPFEEYLVGLFFYALKMLTFEDVTTGVSAEMQQERKEAARVHMLYSASRIAGILAANQDLKNS